MNISLQVKPGVKLNCKLMMSLAEIYVLKFFLPFGENKFVSFHFYYLTVFYLQVIQTGLSANPVTLPTIFL